MPLTPSPMRGAIPRAVGSKSARNSWTSSVELTFEDNGCGIPGELLTKIYDPFFTTKEIGRGTGQGLAIARSIIVDKHDGSIGVVSLAKRRDLLYVTIASAQC